MAITLSSGSFRVSLTASLTEDLASGGVGRTVGLPASVVGAVGATAGIYSKALANGTSSGQGNALFSISGTVTAGSPVSIDLRALPQGSSTLILTSVKSLLVQEASSVNTAANLLLVGDTTGSLSNALTAFWKLSTGQEVIDSQGVWAKHAPNGVVVDSSHRILQLAAAAGSAVYQIDGTGTQ